MIDIHCHILHGVDDGAENFEESIEMARIAYEDGCRHLIATPHFNPIFMVTRDVVEQKVAALQDELDRRDIALQLYTGNEVRLISKTFIEKHTASRSFAFLGPKQSFILLEQDWKQYVPDTPEVCSWFLSQGIIPIIPHPERHGFFREQPHLLTTLLELGAWTQVSADSLVGGNGPDALHFSRWLSDRNLIHTLATDAHNVRRKPNLSAGFTVVSNWTDEQRIAEIQARMAQIIAL